VCGGGGAAVNVETDAEFFEGVLYYLMVSVHDVLRGAAFFSGSDGDGYPVLVGASYEEHLPSLHSHIACIDVGGDIDSCQMSYVYRPVRVGEGGGYQKAFVFLVHISVYWWRKGNKIWRNAEFGAECIILQCEHRSQAMIMEKEEIRKHILGMGVDLAGFSNVSRLADAPKGFAPADVLPRCRTVIAFAIAFPRGGIFSPSPHIYTRIRNSISDRLNGIALDVCLYLESLGAATVPIPTVEDIPDPDTGAEVSLSGLIEAYGTGGRNRCDRTQYPAHHS